MPATAPALLDAAALARRLAELAADDRAVQVELLLHLAEYDRREAWLAAGYGSLWDFCRRALHLREGAAWRRIQAMRVLRRLPELAEPLRSGMLCLTTVALLDSVLTEANAEELVQRAAYKSKAEVEALVVALKPRSAPRDGVRRLPERHEAATAASLPIPAPHRPEPEAMNAAPVPAAVPAPALEVPAPASTAPTRPTVRPVAADTWSLRVTVDAAFKEELDRLTELLSHKVPGGDLSAVLREAVKCAIEKHGKRRGAVDPKRKRAKKAPAAPPVALPASPRREPIAAEVRRQVWRRDEGRCAWVGPDGHHCGSRWRLELDHIEAAALGGPSTVDNLRLTCARHNRLHAEQTFGREFMDRFRREPQTGESTSPSGSCSYAPGGPKWSHR
ncbi:MAG TPA: HNH endonuclease signature motif containing protein [Anaeromyxobacteraceae bacterium]|nr:HNH endonuclease signature motif containing protein [Anaeromyxobacteraceae bacterium]